MKLILSICLCYAGRKSCETRSIFYMFWCFKARRFYQIIVYRCAHCADWVQSNPVSIAASSSQDGTSRRFTKIALLPGNTPYSAEKLHDSRKSYFMGAKVDQNICKKGLLTFWRFNQNAHFVCCRLCVKYALLEQRPYHLELRNDIFYCPY